MHQESEISLIHNLLAKEMKSWQNEEIQEKFRLVMINYNLDMKILASTKRNKKIQAEIVKAKTRNLVIILITLASLWALSTLTLLQDIKKNLSEIQRKKKEISVTQAKAVEFRK
jgi:hypothetical protein